MGTVGKQGGSRDLWACNLLSKGRQSFPSKFRVPDYSVNALYHTKMTGTIRRINSAGNTEISPTPKICDYCLSILLSLCAQSVEL